LEQKDDWETAKSLYPIYVEISPVGACNHRCTFCAVDYIGYKSVILDSSMMCDRLEEMGQLGIKSVMWAGEGEPLLHKQINRLVTRSRVSGLDSSFTTNGVLLDKLETLDLCSWVKVSLNAGTAETYSKVHRTKSSDFTKVISNLKSAVKRKGSCTLGAQMVLLPENVIEAGTLARICSDIGLDYLVLKPYSQHKSSITHEYENVTPVYIGPDEVNGMPVIYREESVKTKEIPYDKCQATPYMWAYVMASGDVYSCSAYLLNDKFNLGNLNKQTFKEIWEGEKRRLNWKHVREELNIKDCRLNCRMDKTNRYLNELVVGAKHQNFI
jgi:radical SAM protein with 4Fe4S-binding SPASM domain